MEHADYYRSLLPLHKIRIEQSLQKSGVDLNDFLDYTQICLDSLITNHKEMEHLRKDGLSGGFFDNTKAIADTEKIQSVIVKMLEGNSTKTKRPAAVYFYEEGESPENTDEIAPNLTKTKRLDQKLIALIYHERGIQIRSQNMDQVAAKNGYTAKNSGKKIQKWYNELADPAHYKKQKKKYQNDIEKYLKDKKI